MKNQTKSYLEVIKEQGEELKKLPQAAPDNLRVGEIVTFWKTEPWDRVGRKTIRSAKKVLCEGVIIWQRENGDFGIRELAPKVLWRKGTQLKRGSRQTR